MSAGKKARVTDGMTDGITCGKAAYKTVAMSGWAAGRVIVRTKATPARAHTGQVGPYARSCSEGRQR